MVRTAGLCLALALTPLLGCNDGGNGANEAACEGLNVTLFPAEGSTNAYYRTSVTARFTGGIPDGATLSVAGDDGEVQGTVSQTGNTLTFTPASPLAPMGGYTTTFTAETELGLCEGGASWSVNEVGSPTSVADLVGKAFRLDLATANFIEPAGVGALLADFLDINLLVGISAVDEGADQVTMIGALGTETTPVAQEPCQETIPFPPASIAQNPYFQAGPQAFTVTVEGTSITIDDLRLAGAFSPDASFIQGIELSGVIDTRPLIAAFPELDPEGELGDDAICELARSLTIECQACPDNSGDYCLSLVADQIQAEGIDFSIEVIEDPCAKAECAADPACAE